GQSVWFADLNNVQASNGTLYIGDLANFQAKIYDFALGDKIDIQTTIGVPNYMPVDSVAKASSTNSSTTLDLFKNGSRVGSLNLEGNYMSKTFLVTSDGHGGSDLGILKTSW